MRPLFAWRRVTSSFRGSETELDLVHHPLKLTLTAPKRNQDLELPTKPLMDKTQLTS